MIRRLFPCVFCFWLLPASAQVNAPVISGGHSHRAVQLELDSLTRLYNRFLRDYTHKFGGNPRSQISSLYKGTRHVISVNSLIDILFELRVKCKVYVVAQALLETGYFSSRIFREYHNLFGLYDSRVGDYYRFACWEDSVVAYMQYIQYRYPGGSYLKFLRDIGYAQDPDYCGKVAVIAEGVARYLAGGADLSQR